MVRVYGKEVSGLIPQHTMQGRCLLTCTKMKKVNGSPITFQDAHEEHLEQNTVEHDNEISKIVHEIGDVLVVIIKSIIYITVNCNNRKCHRVDRKL